MNPKAGQDGYRYCKQYTYRGVRRWALWERVNGKARRVGTAGRYYGEGEAEAFIFYRDKEQGT